jgi:hypothetical protein
VKFLPSGTSLLILKLIKQATLLSLGGALSMEFQGEVFHGAKFLLRMWYLPLPTPVSSNANSVNQGSHVDIVSNEGWQWLATLPGFSK